VSFVSFFKHKTESAAFFKSISYKANLVNNVMFGGPRAAINYNDGFMGGDLMEGNLIFGYVRETNDHASFNSWDRQSWFFRDPRSADVTASSLDHENSSFVRSSSQPPLTSVKPVASSSAAWSGNVSIVGATMQISRNLILNRDFQYGTSNSDWCIDHDDASSWYYDEHNVMAWGAHKWRDGVNKSYVSNLYIAPPYSTPAQQWGIGYYMKNTVSRSRVPSLAQIHAIPDCCLTLCALGSEPPGPLALLEQHNGSF
jgi:hypothetical protein